jgi:hypothetical protein
MGGGGLSTEGRKAFFFEKKKQKTFLSLVPAFQNLRGTIDRSFLLLFFKKEGLPSP